MVKGEVATGVGERNAGVPCLRRRLDTFGRDGAGEAAYLDQLEVGEVIAEAEALEGFFDPGV